MTVASATRSIASVLCAAAFVLGSVCAVALPSSAQIDMTDQFVRQAIFQNLLMSQLQTRAASPRTQPQSVAPEQLGRQRIAAGTATVAFARASAHLAPDAYAGLEADATRRSQTATLYEEALGAFDAWASRLHVRLNDAAETRGLAFALLYQAYSGGQRVPEAQRLLVTREFRASLLKNATFQGSSDRVKQIETEALGIDAIVALAEGALATQRNDRVLREHAIGVAEQALQTISAIPVANLELTSTGFDDRGLRILREGRATTRYALSSTPISTDEDTINGWKAVSRYAQVQGVAMNDIGQVQALAIAINWKVYSGSDLTAKQFGWAVREMTRDVLADPSWQGVTDRMKQLTLEHYTASANAAAAALQAGDAVGARAAAKKNLEALFAPRVFDQYVLVDDGFAPRSGQR